MYIAFHDDAAQTIFSLLLYLLLVCYRQGVVIRL